MDEGCVCIYILITCLALTLSLARCSRAEGKPWHTFGAAVAAPLCDLIALLTPINFCTRCRFITGRSSRSSCSQDLHLLTLPGLFHGPRSVQSVEPFRMTHCSVSGQASLPVQTQLLPGTIRPGEDAYSAHLIVRDLTVRDAYPAAGSCVWIALTSCCILLEAGDTQSTARAAKTLSDTCSADLIRYCPLAARTASE